MKITYKEKSMNLVFRLNEEQLAQGKDLKNYYFHFSHDYLLKKDTILIVRSNYQKVFGFYLPREELNFIKEIERARRPEIDENIDMRKPFLFYFSEDGQI